MQVADDLWEILISNIEERKVVPILGPELLLVPDGDRQVMLYKRIAERLDAKFGLNCQWREGSELNDAVCSYLDNKPRARVEDLYPEIHLILKSLKLAPPASLLKLAGISGFDLFVTTTMDSLLVDALNQVRFAGQPRALQLAYAPNLATGEPRDLPESASADPIVFNLFGKATSSPNFAIHDEDYLEFVHRLETGLGAPARLMRELQTRNLLFLGCQFSDWLNRFLLRLANANRLRSDRERSEYMTWGGSGQDRGLTTFLTRFSIPTRLLDLTGAQFVDELSSRWSQHQAAVAANAQPSARGAIFISYAREDFVAANALRMAVVEIAGDDVCWFDKSTLEPGDRWEDEIRSSIERVRLFLPVISRNTEQRSGEGVVFHEWAYAIDAQKRKSSGSHFIVPIIVDPDFQGDIKNYRYIPEEFRAINVGRAPQGLPDGSLAEALKREIRQMRPGLR